mmetsp:Transcript_23351/g.39781  ORF Transcript_23351/g.39781 Transcript_23351/m.39781 type:complete len:209 (-) Transcript_23351:1597-2223(-)
MMMWRRVVVLTAASSSRTVGAASRRSSSALAFCPSNNHQSKNQHQKRRQEVVTPPLKTTSFLHHKQNIHESLSTTTARQMSFFGGASEGIPRINKEAMTEIIDDVSSTSREESNYVIIDVRGQDEIAYTGKLNDCVETLPLPYIAQGALAMEDEDFKAEFGFDKPALDETLVFTCKAGIRSQQAGQLAKMAGYTDILDYMGGSNEWFS